MLQESVRPRVRLRSLNGPPMQPNPGQGRFTNTMPLAGSGIYFWICILWLQTSHAMELNKLFFFFFWSDHLLASSETLLQILSHYLQLDSIVPIK